MLFIIIRPNGSVNCSGQIDHDVSRQADDLLNSTIQTGRLGNMTVDPNYWLVREHTFGKEAFCKN